MHFRCRCFLIALIAFTCDINAVEYSKSKDDFSNGTIHSVAALSDDARAKILISCFPENRLEVQLATSEVIFPDDTSKRFDRMFVSVTHKFDSAKKAETTNWSMNIMKYNNAWYTGDIVRFIAEAFDASVLALRLDKRNEVYKFDFNRAGAQLRNVVGACIKK